MMTDSSGSYHVEVINGVETDKKSVLAMTTNKSVTYLVLGLR